MSALTASRMTPRRAGSLLTVTASAACFAGGMVSLLTATGLAVPAGTASSGRAVGVATADAAADDVINVEIGIFRFGNSASTDLIEKADIGATCYVVDDQTVALTNGSSTRQIAGAIVDVDDAGVWVKVGTN